jgi:SAM-dependent methyltransferase
MKDWLRRIYFNLAYLGHPRWDTRQSPPELLEFIRSHAPGRVLDLGCGTGTNLITLAQAGWQVYGVDYAPFGTQIARRRMKILQLTGSIMTADVLNLPPLPAPFDLILDIGCYHNLNLIGRVAYRHNLERLLSPTGTWLLYTLHQDPQKPSSGLTELDFSTLTERFHLKKRQDGIDGRRQSSWFWLQLPIVEER